MTKFLKIFLISCLIGIVGLLISFFIFIWFSSSDKEVVCLKNSINKEKIYLIRLACGFNDSRMSIGLNRRLKAGFDNSFLDKYEDNTGNEMFFYKMSNDSLYIYGANFKEPKIKKFKTHIILVSIQNYDFIDLSENKKYEKLGMKVFPPSDEKRLNSNDELEMNKYK